MLEMEKAVDWADWASDERDPEREPEAERSEAAESARRAAVATTVAQSPASMAALRSLREALLGGGAAGVNADRAGEVLDQPEGVAGAVPVHDRHIGPGSAREIQGRREQPP